MRCCFIVFLHYTLLIPNGAHLCTLQYRLHCVQCGCYVIQSTYSHYLHLIHFQCKNWWVRTLVASRWLTLAVGGAHHPCMHTHIQTDLYSSSTVQLQSFPHPYKQYCTNTFHTFFASRVLGLKRLWREHFHKVIRNQSCLLSFANLGERRGEH